jgi:MFS family permease
MLSFLNKKYPFNDDPKYNAKTILLISLGVLGFLMVFQPVSRELFTKMELFYLAIGIAISTFFVLTVNLIVLPSFLPKLFNRERWTIKHEIIWNIWSLVTISACYYLFYTKLFGIIFISFGDFWRVIFLGLIPIAVLIVLNHNRLLRSHLKTSILLNDKLLERKYQKEKLVYFDSDYKKDNLVLKADSIILIRAADNYIEVFYKNNTDLGVNKQMVRQTIKKMEEALREFSFIFQCHRSYIVNTNYIKEVQGNSQGYKLFFDDIAFPALVSQMYIGDLKKLFNL